MEVIFTPLAQRHLQEVFDFISERASEAVASAYIGRIITDCRKLETFPERGTKRDDLLPGLRTLGFERRATLPSWSQKRAC